MAALEALAALEDWRGLGAEGVSFWGVGDLMCGVRKWAGKASGRWGAGGAGAEAGARGAAGEDSAGGISLGFFFTPSGMGFWFRRGLAQASKGQFHM